VNFSEPVVGVDASDFTLAAPGLFGATITDVAAANNSAIVTVYVGAGIGTLRLDLIDDGTITDPAGNHLQGSVTNGEAYNVNTVPVPQLVITQIYGAGGAPGAAYGNDYIEI